MIQPPDAIATGSRTPLGSLAVIGFGALALAAPSAAAQTTIEWARPVDGDPQADLDGDGLLTLFDFLAFQNVFDAGCA